MNEEDLHLEIVKLKREKEIQTKLAQVRKEVISFRTATGLVAGDARYVFRLYENIISLYEKSINE